MSTKTASWDILELPEVQSIIKQAAKRIHRQYETVIEYDDLEQEATIRAVTDKGVIAAARDGEMGLFQYRLEQGLTDMLRPKVKEANNTVSLDALMEEAGDDGFALPYVVIETASNDYTRESVETLLPAVWDDSFVYGLPQRDDAPDPDMPKSASNKAHGNDLSAYIADIKTGWDKTPLTIKERRALFLAFNTTLPGGPWTQREIAFNQGVSQKTISLRLEQAIGKIVARLNGGYWHELEGIEA